MGFIVVLLLVALAIGTVKHINLSFKHTRLVTDHAEIKNEYNNLARIAQRMDIQLGALHEMNRQLMLQNTGPTLETKLVKELIVFCHPDKHGGSEKASRLTQELLKVRDGK